MYRQAQDYSGAMGPLQATELPRYASGPYRMQSFSPQISTPGSQFSQENQYQYQYQFQNQLPQQNYDMFQQQTGQQYYHHPQMDQFLNQQRMQIQEQLETHAMIQRKIDQHKKDQLEIAAVKSKLGDEVCEVHNFPFQILPNAQQPQQYGVIKLCNLPYAVTRHEIHQLLGRHAGILGPELGGGIHIIMERSTAKTMDAFVEFKSQSDAEATVHRLSFTESGHYARLGNRHVDIILSSQDELLQNIFPRAKCIEWRNGVPNLLPNTDPYSAGFQGFLTSEEIRGLVAHATNPARSPFTERCRQRTYECLISTLWKFPWSATTLYTVGDRDELFQATLQQVLELSEKIKQRRVIGLNEALLVDLLRAGVNCPAFNERQKICLYAAAEMPTFSPIVHSKYFEYWPFDCLAKDKSVTEYEVMFYAQLVHHGLDMCEKDDLAVPNNWRNRMGATKESPWGHLWLEWNLHDKTTTFEAAASLEVQLATDLLENATSIKQQQGNQVKVPATGFVVLPKTTSSHHIIKHNPHPLPYPWAAEAARRGAMNQESPSRQGHDNNPNLHAVSDDESFAMAFGGVRLHSGNSSTFSGAASHFGSTNDSILTNDGGDSGISQEKSPANENNIRTRHQYSQSLSAIAAAGIPPANHLKSKDGPSFRRRGTISIPPSTRNFPSDTGADQIAIGSEKPIDINTLMMRHEIWTKSPSGSRHTSNPSVASQPCGLTIVSEDEEDVFNKNTDSKLVK